MNSPAGPAVPPTPPALTAAAGPPYPVAEQPPATAAGVRAAADPIERSGITGLPVACAGGRIGIQVTAGSGDARSRAAAPLRTGREPIQAMSRGEAQ
jgi:hypothetical protein